MIVTEFDHYKAITPAAIYETTPSGFFRALERRGFAEIDDKTAGSLWCPVEFDGTRKKRNVTQAHLVVLDLDDLSAEQIGAIKARVLEHDVEAAMYTTHSHTPEAQRWRLLLSIAEPIKPKHWLSAWHYCVRTFAPEADQQCKDISRMFYYPSVRPGEKGEFWLNL